MGSCKLKASLEFFNEKADKLLDLSFTKAVRSLKTGLSISSRRLEDGFFITTSERRGPDAESIDAFVLTLRFFLQENEKCSIVRMAECYELLDIAMSLKNEFIEIRTAINNFLDSVPADLRIEHDSRYLTRREIVETVVYGDIAHANIGKRLTHKSLTKCEISKNALDYAFVSILSRLTLPIREIRDLNLKVLASLD